MTEGSGKCWAAFIFISAFPLVRVAGSADLGGLGIPRGQQQYQIVPLAPHQDGTKQGRRCSQSTWSLDTHWAGALSDGYSQQYMLHQASLWYSGHITESTKLGSLDRFGRELARNFGFYKFHSCSLCHKVLQSGLSAKIPSLPFALEIVFLQSLPNIHDHILVSERCDTSRLLKI